MKIVVLGGAGKMGCIAVQDLAGDRRGHQVVIADRDVGQARTVAETIGSSKVSVQPVDLHNRAALAGALKGADVCLNGTVYYTNLPVMEACLEAGVSYTDMGGLFHTTRKQLELHERFAEAGLSAVLGMGSAPGVPNVQARYAADRLDSIETIRIYDGIKPPPAGRRALHLRRSDHPGRNDDAAHGVPKWGVRRLRAAERVGGLCSRHPSASCRCTSRCTPRSPRYRLRSQARV